MGFDEPVARRETPGKSLGCVVGFFGIFLLAGLGFSAVFAVPLWRNLQARSWPEAPCEVLESRVASHAGDDGDTYSVEVRYRYRVDGRDHVSERYDFFPGSTSGYEGKARVVERLPPGTRTVCYVDPADPTEAVLDRSFTAEYLFGLLPLAFVGVGAGGIVLTLVGARRGKARRAAGRPEWLPEPSGEPAAKAAGARHGLSVPSAGDAAPLVLEAKMSPLGRLVGTTLVALFWNGIVGVFLWQLWQGWREGSFDGCVAVFLVPFVLVGVLLLAGIPYQVLALFNPRPRLVLTPGRLELGGSAELSWRFRGWPGRIRRLRLTLEGVEEASWSGGKSRRTARETFASYDLLDTRLPIEIAGGSIQVWAPPETMHTFEAADNRVLWTLKLHGEIRLWPDVSEEIRVVVGPRRLPGAGFRAGGETR
ncbi:MAG TPA: DUF3592 domain-containing protein [Thermoanaerobaculia bacterium]|nr:DUF3592 domain-containing protein [Thermoanaerobaculia bacterium]